MAIFFGSTEQIYWTATTWLPALVILLSFWPHINSLFIYLFLLLIVYVDIIASFFACNGPFYFFTIALNFINCDLFNCAKLKLWPCIIASFFACYGPFNFFTIALNFINGYLLNCANLKLWPVAVCNVCDNINMAPS